MLIELLLAFPTAGSSDCRWRGFDCSDDRTCWHQVAAQCIAADTSPL